MENFGSEAKSAGVVLDRLWQVTRSGRERGRWMRQDHPHLENTVGLREDMWTAAAGRQPMARQSNEKHSQ